MAELKSRDHLGHYILEAFTTFPDHVIAIDAATGASRTNASYHHRCVSLARAISNFGLKPGDVVTFSGRNHVDIRLPYFAAMMIGCPIAGVDPSFKFLEIKHLLDRAKPKLSFCEQDSLEDTKRAIRELNLGTTVVSFDEGADSLKCFLEKYAGDDNEEFVLPDFDPETTLAWLLSTSGTSGTPKLACYYHKPVLDTMRSWVNRFKMSNTKSVLIKSVQLNLAPVQWTSAYISSLLGIGIRSTIVQTSAPATVEHLIDIINEYKPTTTTFGPTLCRQLLQSPKHCDLSSFSYITLCGGKVGTELMREIRSRVSNDCLVVEMYGQTETLSPVFEAAPEGPPGNCGQLYPLAQAQLVNEDHEVITEAHTPGELWIKAEGFAGYYNMPEETKNAYSPDGWYKTGDILYRDENNYFFYVERATFLIKYKGHIYPCELEDVLRSHSGVLDAAVTSVKDNLGFDLPVACVVRKNQQVTAKELRELVAEKLSERKQLRGGVVFVDELPLTSTGKIARSQLREIVMRSDREF